MSREKSIKAVDNPVDKSLLAFQLVVEVLEMAEKKKLSTEIVQEALKRLRKAQTNGDPKIVHVQADKVLCDLLACLGLEDVIVQYKAMS